VSIAKCVFSPSTVLDTTTTCWLAKVMKEWLTMVDNHLQVWPSIGLSEEDDPDMPSFKGNHSTSTNERGWKLQHGEMSGLR
jgi:hypothetical protein